MQIALVNEKRTLAFVKGIGICPICHSEVIAKCGSKKIFHWAHKSLNDCDPWWENETEWHRNWKNQFPEECREISYKDSITNEVHRADIQTATGIVIEIQHSPMTDKERISREEFYKNMIWVLDGSRFKKNFKTCHMLPDPKSELSKKIRWFKAGNNLLGANNGIFYYQNYVESLEFDSDLVQVHSIDIIQSEIAKTYNGYHQYYWKSPHSTWMNSTFPIYIDFGDDYLVQLVKYGDYELLAIKLVAKQKFLHDVMHEYQAINVGTRFYPIKIEA